MSSDNKYTYAWPLHTYYAAYIDFKKSVPHLVKGEVENPRGLPYWKPLGRYLVSVEDYLNVIEDFDLEEHVIIDEHTGNELIRFFVEKGKSAIYDGKEGNGMFAMKYTPSLMAYRKRKDGLLGLEAVGGFVDTRLSIDEKQKHPDKYPINVRATDKDEANFNSEKSVYKKANKQIKRS